MEHFRIVEHASFSRVPRVKDRFHNFENDSRNYAKGIRAKVERPLKELHPGQPTDAILASLTSEDVHHLKDRLTTLLDPDKQSRTEQPDQPEVKKKPLSRKEILNNLPSILESISLAAVTELGQLPHEEQLMASLAMITSDKGYAINQYTGEGKTMVAAITASVDALEGKGVHVATANDYLAKRDAAEMGAVYHALGLSVAVITSDGWQYIYDPEAIEDGTNLNKLRRIGEEANNMSARSEAYNADVTYGQGSEFIFDYLKDSTSFEPGVKRQRGFHSIIIDEIDKVLIDDAVTPAILTAQMGNDVLFTRNVDGKENVFTERDINLLFAELVNDLPRQTIFAMLSEDDPTRAPEQLSTRKKDIQAEEKSKDIRSSRGYKRIDTVLQEMGILAEGQSIHGEDTPDSAQLHLALWQALRARGLYTFNKNYIIKDEKVQLIEEYGGHILEGRKLQDGLHAALEAKEVIDGRLSMDNITPQDYVQDAITFQNYMLMYARLNGMSGTADKVKDELKHAYELDVVTIPPHKKIERVDDMTERIYRTKKEKYDAMVERVIGVYQDKDSQGRPILVGLQTVEDVVDFHENYLKPAVEAYNAAHPDSLIHLQYLTAENSEKEAAVIAQAGRLNTITVSNMTGRGTDIKLGGNPPDPSEREKVIGLKGLLAIGEHGTEQTDWQFRGRSGRQGEPGNTEFYTSLEDEFLQDYAKGNQVPFNMTFGLPKYQKIGRIEGERGTYAFMAVHNAQKKNKEAEQSDMLLQENEYKYVINPQRKVYLEDRDKILQGDPFMYLHDMIEKHITHTEEYQERLADAIQPGATITAADIAIDNQLLSDNENKIVAGTDSETLRSQMLHRVSVLWRDHLTNLEVLRIASHNQANRIQSYEEFAQIAGKKLQDFKESVYAFLTQYHYTPTQKEADQ